MVERKKTLVMKQSKALLWVAALVSLVAFTNCKGKTGPAGTEPSTEEAVMPAATDTATIVVPPAPAAVTPPAKTPEKTTSGSKQEKPAPVAPVDESEHVFEVVETMPEFPGGQAELMKYLNKNMKYPVAAAEKGVEGNVVVQFVVYKDGSIVDPVVVKSVDPILDKEAIRVVSSMPKWKPGVQGGKIVRTKYTLPVKFELK